MDVARGIYGQLAPFGLHIGPETQSLRLTSLIFEKPVRLFEYSSIYGSSKIGAYTYINKHFNINSVDIGRYCAMASYIREVGDHEKTALSTHMIFTDRSDSLFPGDEIYAELMGSRKAEHYRPPGLPPIRIGHDVWIGEGVLLMSGVRIGNGAIIGANTFVRDDVPAYSVVAGCPGKVRKMRFPDVVIERLERVQWWNYNPADFANHVDFRDVEQSLDFIEEGIAASTIRLLQPRRFMLAAGPETFKLTEIV